MLERDMFSVPLDADALLFNIRLPATEYRDIAAF
jgi:hypothetical protein